METRGAVPTSDKTDVVTPVENPAMDLTDLIQTLPVIEWCGDNSVDCISPTGSLEELEQVNWWEVLLRKDAGAFTAKPATRARRDFQQLYQVCGRTSEACSPFDLRIEAIFVRLRIQITCGVSAGVRKCGNVVRYNFSWTL